MRKFSMDIKWPSPSNTLQVGKRKVGRVKTDVKTVVKLSEGTFSLLKPYQEIRVIFRLSYRHVAY